MEDIRIVNESLPVIQINFTEMKEALTNALIKYQGIVVTEETLSGCKSTQKELAGLRIKIDTYRKDKKKELSKPIAVFEDQCKDLISLIEKAERPIKDGIKVFDDEKRDEKRKMAIRLTAEVVADLGLNEKYGSRLDVLDKYCNLTSKESDVRGDLEARAMALMVEQDREAELIDIIKDSIDTENQRINSKMSFDDFSRLVDRGVPTKDILAEVKARAESIYRAENPPKPEPVIEPAEEPIPEPVEEPVFVPQSEPIKEVDESIYYATYRITGSLEQLKSVSAFLKEKGIAYKVTDQGEL